MTVFVDALRPSLRNKRWHHDHSCHLFADSLEELHAFAVRIGLRRCWFQGDRRLPHYDLTEGKRLRAILNGAVEADRATVVTHMRPVAEVRYHVRRRYGPGGR